MLVLIKIWKVSVIRPQYNCIIGLIQSAARQSFWFLREKTNRIFTLSRYTQWNRIYHHHHSIPYGGNPFKSMFSPQTPAFQAAQCCSALSLSLFPREGLRVQHRSMTSLSEITLYCSIISDYTRRRRPMTLRIGPRLSLPSKSTSAPTTTTDGEWRALR